MAYNSQINYEGATHFFVNALTLNPKAEHIWNYLNTQMTRMDKFEWKERVYAKDLKFLQDKFGPVLNLHNMPKPNLDKLYDNPIWNK